MLTTQRKIEIATAVMDHPLLGTRTGHNLYAGICYILGKVDYKHQQDLILDMAKFNWQIGGYSNTSSYWYTTNGENHKTERIEFLQKYINHLKQQENE